MSSGARLAPGGKEFLEPSGCAGASPSVFKPAMQQKVVSDCDLTEAREPSLTPFRRECLGRLIRQLTYTCQTVSRGERGLERNGDSRSDVVMRVPGPL